MLKEKIAQQLKEMFDPDAVILHGSRARKMSRAGSDWDFILLYNSQTTHKSNRANIAGQNVEYTVFTLPISDIWDSFGAKLNQADVIFEKDNVGSNLLTQAASYYTKGVHWSETKKATHKLWLEGRIEGMRHYVNEPEMFYKYFSDLYSRLTNYWYWVKQHQHSEPIYIAIPEIAEKDPKYADLLRQLTNPETTLEEKVSLSDKINTYLFN